jgi:nitrogen fixation protein FixH
MIVGLLGLQIVLCMIAVYLAVSDPTMAIEPDYYRKAVDWDATAAERRASEALGWTHELTLDAGADVLGRRAVSLTLTGEDGEPLTGAVVELEAFAQARATHRFTLTLVEQPPGTPGRYTGLLPVRHTGLWEFTLTVKRNRDVYTHTDRVEVQERGHSTLLKKKNVPFLFDAGGAA